LLAATGVAADSCPAHIVIGLVCRLQYCSRSAARRLSQTDCLPVVPLFKIYTARRLPSPKTTRASFGSGGLLK
jgi:hypothetical protein